MHPICLPFLLSYVVLGLVLLELGWAGVGISWLALFHPRTPICLPFLLSYFALGLVLLELGWVGRRNFLACLF